MAPIQGRKFVYSLSIILSSMVLAEPALSAGGARVSGHFSEHFSGRFSPDLYELRRDAAAAHAQKLEQDRLKSLFDPDILERRDYERWLSPSMVRSEPAEPAKPVSYSIRDVAFATGAERKALERFLANDQIAKRIDIASWAFTNPPTQKVIGDTLARAREELPGKIELGLLLDRTTFGEAYKSIVNSWQDRPTSEMPTSDLIRDYMSSRRGSTLIVVGHVVGDAYVSEDASGRSFSINIRQLIAEAEFNNVVLIPLGCSTALAGATFGFLHPIGTDTVAAFLQTFPVKNALYADVFAGFAKIGQVSLDNPEGGKPSSVRVEPTERASDRASTKAEKELPPISTMRVSYQSSSPSRSSFQASFASDVAAYNPDITNYKLFINCLIALAAWIGVIISTRLACVAIRPWALQRRDRNWIYRTLLFPGAVTMRAMTVAPTVVFFGAVPAGLIIGYLLGGTSGLMSGGFIGGFVVYEMVKWTERGWL
jgi:hypothetical protein